MTLTILEGSTFCICDDLGDVGGETSGFFANDTRFLSKLALTINGATPLPLSSGKVEYFSAAFFLRNPLSGSLQQDQLSVRRERFVGEALKGRREQVVLATKFGGGKRNGGGGSLLKVSGEDLGIGPFAVRSSGIAEDGAERSFAGMYETVLDVSADGLPSAADRVLASAHASRAKAYGPRANGEMAVIVQRMVAAAAAGVALTADRISGDRRSCVITAVRGLGERLVSGASAGDEWVVRDRVATARRQPEHAIDRNQALRVASEGRRIAAVMDAPQDIEWAIADGQIFLLQSRPVTAF